MKTRNQKARAVQNLSGIIMLASGTASVCYACHLTWYNAPALLCGSYFLFTRRLLVGWND